ncbi:mitochondrial thiamine pyrophosphate carrier 1 [Phialemonium atrogriseum]|uniref:Mitochondrial thiamine pyrophosphate carrier 1 n=1 Tax=Phialemonium atrogriseum TaxID=1093897 RepID=A0AAJ0C6L6_9PEZI|nr:mitochondrial thiamine pyrophosphate carrier 1 [Phialemonium atrogriseum]KAK1769672.1 mitochondrial thiamine pyrophosphate carrier 1 [Phialemonium atrogriseum]
MLNRPKPQLWCSSAELDGMLGKGEHLKDEGSRLQVVAAGATAGLISRFVVAPLDVVKIRLQLQTHSLSDPRSHKDLNGGPIYKGTIPTIRHILRHEGLTGLWKGNVPAELMYVCYSAIQFTTYRSATLLLHRAFGEGRLPHAAESFIAGAAGGATATASTYPLDLLRTRFAAQGNDRVYPSLRRAILTIKRDEGFRGFFRGLGPALGQIVPFMGTFFAVYESLRLPLGRLELPFGSGDATAGVMASVIAKTCTFPLDLVRKRIQVQGPTRSKYVHKNIPEYRGTVRTVQMILATEGIRGLYRGLTVSLFKAAPASAVTMWTYEQALKFYVGVGEKIDDGSFMG